MSGTFQVLFEAEFYIAWWNHTQSAESASFLCLCASILNRAPLMCLQLVNTHLPPLRLLAGTFFLAFGFRTCCLGMMLSLHRCGSYCIFVQILAFSGRFAIS